jgi:hypothetical protein
MTVAGSAANVKRQRPELGMEIPETRGLADLKHFREP